MNRSEGRAGGRRALLHLGMAKTGSTSIQEVWNGYEDDRVEYASLGLANHSLVLQRAFLDGEAADRVFCNAQGEKRDKQRDAAIRKLDTVFGRTSRSLILSAEALFRLEEEAARDLVAFLRRHVEGIDALLYVRAPESYARSVFQERLKRRDAFFDIRHIIPNYRERSLAWASALGAEPTYVMFDRSALKDGDVVADFGMRFGLDPAWAESRKHLQNRNTSLSAEGMAALYLLRHRHGAPATHNEERLRQKRLIEVLGGYGTHRYDFGRALMDAALAAQAESIAWMEGRLGRPFAKEVVKNPVVFGSEREVLDYAEAQAPALREHLLGQGVRMEGVGRTTLELLEAVLAQAPAAPVKVPRRGAPAGPRRAGPEAAPRPGLMRQALRGLLRPFARARG